MKILRLLAGFIALIFAYDALPQEVDVKAPNLNDEIPVDSKVRVGKLDNGLSYFIRKNEKPENRVQFRLVVKAGSVLEDNNQLGLAHFVEHMAFNGSEHFEKNELVDYLQSVGVQFGADLNAYTSFDETVYMLPIPTEDEEIMDKGMLVLEDWANGVSFTDEEIDKERGVVIEEWRLGRGAQQRMRDKWLPMALKDSRYADRLPIGTKEILESFDYETVRKFYRDWYRPELMAVIAVGDIDVDEIEKEIKERFGDIENPDNPRQRERFPIPDHDETYIVTAKDPEASFTQLQLIYKHDKEEETTLNDYRRVVIHSLYNGMLSVRFQELTQQADPPFIFGASNYGGFIGDYDSYTAFAAVGPGGVEKGLTALITENERVRQHGFTAGELARYKKELLNNYERSYNERDKTQSMQYAQEYIRAFLENEPIPGIEWEYEFVKGILPTITLDEVNELAPKWITDKNRVVIVTGPDKEGVDIPDEEAIRKILEANDGKETAPYVDEMSGAALISVLPAAGTVSSSKAVEKPLIDLNGALRSCETEYEKASSSLLLFFNSVVRSDTCSSSFSLFLLNSDWAWSRSVTSDTSDATPITLPSSATRGVLYHSHIIESPSLVTLT
jgi:zinc protease